MIEKTSPGFMRILPILCFPFLWLVGWLVERLTAVAVVHRHNLRQQISGSAPETSLLPSPPASGGLLEQKQEQERKDSKQKKAPNNPKKEPLAS